MKPLASTPPPLTLHPLSSTGAPELQAVYQAGADYFLRTADEQPYHPQAQDGLDPSAADEGRFLLGIHLHDAMVGVIDLRLASPGPFDVSIGLILLAEGQRRQGLGSWALRILEAWLSRDTPTEAVIVAVPAQNHAAQAFFQANGYTFTGQSTRVLVGSSRPRLLEMRKSLV
ncbi:MAG TPA: GNAT family N-acetyltransferase [Anaerolineae bacterium]|nr:GNAT family N-acetyltransferase [Anaerolineae bacterium]